mgnify:FL=1
MSKIEDEVCKKIQQRAAVGKKKYGVTMERGDLSLGEWLTHLQEELMDAAVYVQRLIEETSGLIESAVHEAIAARQDKRKTGKQKKWTVDTTRQLRDLRIEYPHATKTRLAEMMDHSVSVVSNALRLMDARVTMGKDPVPPQPISMTNGRPCIRKRWTPKEKEQINELLGQGLDHFVVAAMVDAPNANSIKVWQRELGL